MTCVFVFVLVYVTCVLLKPPFQSGPVPNKIQYPLNDQQKTAITRNIEKMLHEALQDPAEVSMISLLACDYRIAGNFHCFRYEHRKIIFVVLFSSVKQGTCM